MSKAKLGTFDDLMKPAPDDVQAVARKLRKAVLDVHPDAVEVVRLGDRAATYGLGPKKMSEGYVYLQPHKQWVNLGFYKGALLPDPEGLLEGSGAKMRHIKVRSLAEAKRPALRALVEAALAERKEALGR